MTSCGCSGVESEVEGQTVRVSSLDIPPGKSVDLMLRWAIRGEPGSPGQTSIRFQSNDPNHFDVEIKVNTPSIIGTVGADPAKLTLGSLVLGEDQRRTIMVRDQGSTRRTVTRVVSTAPDQVSVRLINHETDAEIDSPLGSLIGLIEVGIHAQVVGPLAGSISAYDSESGDALLAIPFEGRVLPEVELVPSTIILPRISEAGPVYQGRCLFKNSRQNPCSIEVQSAPKGLSVVVSPVPDSPTTYWLQVSWQQPADQPPATGKKVARLIAKYTDRSIPMDLTVSFRDVLNPD